MKKIRILRWISVFGVLWSAIAMAAPRKHIKTAPRKHTKIAPHKHTKTAPRKHMKIAPRKHMKIAPHKHIQTAPLKYTEDRLPVSLNPIYADNMYSVRITELVFDRLIGWDDELRPAPSLATSWEKAANGSSITLKLRSGVTWHDGKPFTARDVAFTMKAMTSRRTQIRDRYLAKIIRNVKILAPLRIRINFKKRVKNPLRWLQFPIIPKHRFKRLPRRSDYFSQKPYGTGPFRFHIWIGKKIILRRNKRYWRAQQGKLSGVTLLVIPDKQLQMEVLRFGGIDSIVRARPKDLPLFEKQRNIRLYPYSTNDWWYLGLNHKKGSIFRDKRIREAFLYSLDRDSLLTAYMGDGQVISGPFSPNDPLYNFSVPVRTQNLKKARMLFQRAGWKLQGKYLYKKKKKLVVRLLIPRSKSSYRALVLALQSQLRRVGITLRPVWLSDTAWNHLVFTKKRFDMTLHIWNFDSLANITPLFHSKGSCNYIQYRNQRIDQLLTLAQQTTDPLVYKAIFGKIHKLLHEELPYLFLWSLTNYTAMSSRVSRVKIHPFNYFHYAPRWKKEREK